MNGFTYKDTIILESQFDFSRLEESISFSGEVILSATISVPNDLERNKIVLCTLDLSLGTDADKLKLHIKSRSAFEIDNLTAIETLQEDAKAQCTPKAGEVLAERIAELTRLHIGKPLNIPISEAF